MVDSHAIDLNNDLSLSISYQLVSFPDHSLERLHFPVTENPSLYLKEAQLEVLNWPNGTDQSTINQTESKI